LRILKRNRSLRIVHPLLVIWSPVFEETQLETLAKDDLTIRKRGDFLKYTSRVFLFEEIEDATGFSCNCLDWS